MNPFDFQGQSHCGLVLLIIWLSKIEYAIARGCFACLAFINSFNDPGIQDSGAYIFLIIFLMLAGVFTFYMGMFFDQ